MNLPAFKSLPTLEKLQKLELKPSTLLIALGGVLLIAYAVIGVSYFRTQQEQSGLREQIAAGGGTLSGVGDSQQTLQDMRDSLAAAEQSLSSLQNALPQSLNNAALVESLLGYAGQSRVRIAQMNALPVKDLQAADKEKGGGYVVLSLTLTAQGSLPDLFTFLSLIEKETSQTVAVGDMSLTPATGGQEMKVELAYYARPAIAEATPAAGQSNQTGGGQ
jgi:Tfp pilus assembly protein PilO